MMPQSRLRRQEGSPQNEKWKDAGSDATFSVPLRAWRLEEACEQALGAFVVFDDSQLQAIVAATPTTREALSEAQGVGVGKIGAYGTAVIRLVHEHLKSGDGSGALIEFSQSSRSFELQCGQRSSRLWWVADHRVMGGQCLESYCGTDRIKDWCRLLPKKALTPVASYDILTISQLLTGG